MNSEEKRFYIFGDVYHQDDTGIRTELLGDEDSVDKTNKQINYIMNRSFVPRNIFVIEGIKKELKLFII